jgi:hypothetical protein
MNQGTSKKLRKYIIKNIEEVLFILRNYYGSLTENMSEAQVYRAVKKLYYQGKIKLN